MVFVPPVNTLSPMAESLSISSRGLFLTASYMSTSSTVIMKNDNDYRYYLRCEIFKVVADRLDNKHIPSDSVLISSCGFFCAD